MTKVEILKQQIAECDKEIEELDLKIEAMEYLFQQITSIDILPTLKERVCSTSNS